MTPWLRELFPHNPRPLLGMIHLLPLPGSPGWRGDLRAVIEAAQRDALALAEGGIDGIMVENFGDAPFWPRRVPAVTIASLTRVATEIRRTAPLPLGINVLRNDGEGAMAIATAVGASLIRVNVLAGARVTDQGVLEGQAHRLLRLRRELGAQRVKILADVAVKHSAPLGEPRPLAEEIEETAGRGGADGIILSGSGTGRAPGGSTLEELLHNQRARNAGEPQGAIFRTPLLIGSGLTEENAPEMLAAADGAIVGSSLKVDGELLAPVDPLRVRRLVDLVKELPLSANP
ncbi:MAG: BtpA/SgcQ family protein [Acidobacteriota bacterium]